MSVCELTLSVWWQMTSTVFDTAAVKDLEPYNNTYVFMLINCQCFTVAQG